MDQPELNVKSKRQLHCGDLVVADDGDLGLTFYERGEGDALIKKTFLNRLGEVALAKWILEKYLK